MPAHLKEALKRQLEQFKAIFQETKVPEKLKGRVE